MARSEKITSVRRIEQGDGVVGEEYRVAENIEKQKEVKRLKRSLNRIIRKIFSSKEDTNSILLSAKYLVGHQAIHHLLSQIDLNIDNESRQDIQRLYWEIPFSQSEGEVLIGEYTVQNFPGKIEIWTGKISRMSLFLRAALFNVLIERYVKDFYLLSAKTNVLDKANLILSLCRLLNTNSHIVVAVSRLNANPHKKHLIGGVLSSNMNMAEFEKHSLVHLLRPEFKYLEVMLNMNIYPLQNLSVPMLLGVKDILDIGTKQEINQLLLKLFFQYKDLTKNSSTQLET